MKLKDILTEGVTPADYTREADPEFDAAANPIADLFRTMNQDYYREHFTEFYESGAVPIFTKPAREKVKYTTKPDPHGLASPGSRGLDLVRNRIKT